MPQRDAGAAVTRLLAATPEGIAEAAALLLAGRLVAFGTETVYGLGARADDDAAVAAIYAAKGRPSYNPLICHYPAAAAAGSDVIMGALACSLARECWPGPLTMILPRQPGGRVCDRAGGGLSTLGIRIPAHPIARRLLEAVGVPIAAPSANRSGRISPTTAAHVLDSLDGRIDVVLDCGPCAVGLESTIIDLSDRPPALLRQGGVSQARLEALLGPLAGGDGSIRAPGQLASHYAPELPLRLDAASVAPDEALLAFGAPLQGGSITYQLSLTADLGAAAARLFAGLRALDAQGAALGLRGIAAMPIPEVGLGAAINDRLARAAHRVKP